MKTLIVLEESTTEREKMTALLRGLGYLVESAADVRDLRALLARLHSVSLFLISVREAGPDMQKLWWELRNRWPEAFIFGLADADNASLRAEVINLGADDCIGRPIEEGELVARINNLLVRRTPHGRVTIAGNTTIKQEFRYVEIEGQSHQLPAKEFFLLRCLAQVPGRVFTRDELLDIIWGVDAEVETNVLEVTISNLRKRLERLGSNIRIKNSRNLGYWLEK